MASIGYVPRQASKRQLGKVGRYYVRYEMSAGQGWDVGCLRLPLGFARQLCTWDLACHSSPWTSHRTKSLPAWDNMDNGGRAGIIQHGKHTTDRHHKYLPSSGGSAPARGIGDMDPHMHDANRQSQWAMGNGQTSG